MDTAKENKLYESVKNDFYKNYKTNIENGDYHEKDLARLRADTNHDWAKAFYKHGFGSYDKTVSIIHEVLLWRKEFDANNLLTPGKLPFPQEFLQRGSCYFRNEDINCNPLLHFVVRLHRKDQMPYAAVCRYIAYHFELAYMFNDTDPIVLLFDMSEAGYSNLDMDMIKFVVSCLKTYYPGLIDYMVIFQMPFIFNAAWKIIKNWLPPEGVKLIKFCDKKSIREYIQESQLFVHMGGTDAYKYAYDPKNYVLTGETRGVRPFLSSKSFYSPSMPQIAASSTSSTKTSSDSGYGSSVKSGSSTANSDTAAASKSSGSEDAASRSSIDANSSSSSNEKNNSKAASIVNGTTTTKNNTSVDTKPQKVQPQQSVERQMSNKYSFKSIVSNLPEAQQPQQTNTVNSANNNTIHTVDLSKSEVNFTLSEDSPTSKPKLANNNNSNDETKPTSEKVVSEPKNKSPKTNGRPPNGFVSSISYDVRKATELSFENTLATPLLSISPGDEVVFNVTDGKSDVVQFIKLTNTSGLSLAYKIKITSPDKFRVKPGTGIIQTSSCASIMISFLKEFHMTNTGNRDKFLILWTPIEEQIVQQSELNEFWKQAMQKKTNINEHKIKCVIIRPQMNSTAAVTASTVESSTKSSHHKSQIHHAGSKLNQVLGETIMKDDKSINAEQMSKNEAHLTSTKIYNLELNMNCVLDNQNRLMRQQSMMTCLIFFLILLNLIQLLFHSNFFNQFVEPFIDDLFFTKS